MKVIVENKKGLEKDLKVFIDKKTITTQLEEKYDSIIIKIDTIKNMEKTDINKLELKNITLWHLQNHQQQIC